MKVPQFYEDAYIILTNAVVSMSTNDTWQNWRYYIDLGLSRRPRGVRHIQYTGPMAFSSRPVKRGQL